MTAEGTPPAQGTRRIDRVLAEDYLSGLGGAPLADVRTLRGEAEQEEVDLSYLRRLIQGRLDVLRAELNRRDGSGKNLVEDLAGILADEPRSPARGLGRHSQRRAEPGRQPPPLRRGAGRRRRPVRRQRPHARTTSHHAMRVLSEEEQKLSAKRRDVQKVMDACTRRDHPALPRRRGRRQRPARRGPGELSAPPVLVEVVRSGWVEGTHAGSVVALRPDGSTRARPRRPRASGLPAQLEQAAAGGRPAARGLAAGRRRRRWRSRPRRTAARTCTSTSCAGCSRRAGLAEDALGCPPMLPLYDAAAHALLARGRRRPSRLTMNCSGKHAAMLATCVVERLADRRLPRAGPPAAGRAAGGGRGRSPASRCCTSRSTAAARRSTR